MSITPDTKDWTWVLDEPCDECGLDSATVEPRDVAELVRESLPRWREVLGRADVAERPDPATWSPLEYGCHVRDVLVLFDQRVRLMLEQDDPMFANWDQDATAEAERYGEQDPAEVADALESAGRDLADRFDAVAGKEWDRTGRRSDGTSFTVATLAQYFWHDVAHHLHDVRG